jgi:hypothetical protein
MMAPELIDELVATAANLATLLVMRPDQAAVLSLYNARAHIFTAMAEEFGDDIGREIADAFANAVQGHCAELEAASRITGIQ